MSWKSWAAVGLLVCLCAGCGKGWKTKAVYDTRAAMAVEDVALEGPYTGTEVSEGEYSWYDVEEEVSLAKGDIVLILRAEEDGRRLVLLPYGEQPYLHGYVPGEALTRDKEALKGGNQAQLLGAQTYDGPNGRALGTVSVAIEVAQRENGWVKGIPLGCDWDPVWVRAESLMFGFHGPCYDRE